MPSRIVTSTYRYKRPPLIEVPAIVRIDTAVLPVGRRVLHVGLPLSFR